MRVREVLGIVFALLVTLTCAFLMAGAMLVITFGLFCQQWDAVGVGVFAMIVLSTLATFAYRSV